MLDVPLVPRFDCAQALRILNRLSSPNTALNVNRKERCRDFSTEGLASGLVEGGLAGCASSLLRLLGMPPVFRVASLTAGPTPRLEVSVATH